MLTITDTMGSSNILLPETINCPSPHSLLKPIHEPVIDLNLEDSKIYVGLNIVDDTYRAKMTCTSNVGLCSAKQGNQSPDIIEIVISPNQFIANTTVIALQIFNIKNESIYDKQFNNPLKLDSAQYIPSTPLQGEWVNSVNSEDSYLFTRFTIEGDIGQSWSYSPKALFPIAQPLVPVLGNEHSQIVFGYNKYSGNSHTTEFYKRTNNASTTLVQKKDFKIPNPSFPTMQVSTLFKKDTSKNLMFFSIKTPIVGVYGAQTRFSIINTQDLVSLPFPYGFSRSSISSSFLFSSLQLFPGSKSVGGNINVKNILNVPVSLNVTFPSQGNIINSRDFIFEFKQKRFIGNSMGIQIRLVNLDFGVFSYSVSFNSQVYKFYAFDTLVSGNFNDGVYEFFVSTLDYANQMTINISDIYGNINTIDEKSLDFALQTLPVKIQDTKLQISDIKNFFFSSNLFDTSLKERKGSVFFSLGDVKKDHITSLILVYDSRQAFAGVFVDSLQMYRIDFNINFKIPSSSLQYTLNIGGTHFQSHHLISKFRDNANLKLVRSDIDNYPPMISRIDYIAGREVTLNVSSPEKYIGWRLTITDRPNGLKYGNITVMSTFDTYPTSFVFDESNKISGDQYQGIYEIKFKVNIKIQSQSYKITNVYLEDSFGEFSVYPFAGSSKMIFSPFYELGSYKHDIKLTTPIEVLSETIPTLTAFTYVSVAGLKNQYTFTIKTQDTGNGTLSGINQNRPPVIFVQSYLGLYQSFTTKFISKDVKLIHTFEVTTELDPKLTYYGCHLSVYGIFNNDLAVKGYSSIDLKDNGYTYFIKTSSIGNPVIESTNMISQFGGQLTINGKRFRDNYRVYLKMVLHLNHFVSQLETLHYHKSKLKTF